MTLPGTISAAAGQPATVRIGTVVSTSPLTVDVQGTVFTNLGSIGFCPAVGDTVALLGQSASTSSDQASWLVLGATTCHGAWEAYDVAWTTVNNPQPSIGSGRLEGRFMVAGKTGWVWILMVAGSDTTFGTGNWAFSLPFTARDVSSASAQCRDNSAPAASRPGTAAVFGSSAEFLRTFTSSGIVTSGVPFTWAVNDVFSINGCFEII